MNRETMQVVYQEIDAILGRENKYNADAVLAELKAKLIGLEKENNKSSRICSVCGDYMHPACIPSNSND